MNTPDPQTFPGSTIVAMGTYSTLNSKDDPEDTLQVALTHRDVAFIVFCTTFLIRAFPELSEACEGTMRKLIELSAAQGFLPWDDDEINDIMGGLK